MTKRQHYVPRFYLRNFTDADGYLWVYDTQNSCVKRMQPEAICAESYLYETKFENPQAGKFVNPNEIECHFRKYEKEYSDLIRRIKSICVPEQNINALFLNAKEKRVLISFVVNLFVRNPQNMQELNLTELSNEVYRSKDYENAAKKLLDECDIDDTKSFFLAAQKNVMLTEEFPGSLPMQIMQNLLRLNFTFLFAQEDMFITSDVPVIAGEDLSITDGNPTCLFSALTPKVAVIFGNYQFLAGKRNQMVPIKRKTVSHLNKLSIVQTQDLYRRWIISCSKDQIEKYGRRVQNVI